MSVPLSVPPPEALLSVIVVVLVGLAGLLLASCDCTVTLNAVPAVPVLGTVVYASFVASPGLTVVIVAEPVWPDPSFTVTVKLLPATVGVTLALLNTPAVNAGDVPVTPAVPPYVTVEVKPVAVLLFASCAVIVAMVNAVPAVFVPEIAEITK